MVYHSYAPASPLSDYIDRIWYCSDSPPHPHEQIVPNGTFELVINLRTNEIRTYDPSQHNRCMRYSGAVVCGTYSKHFMIDTLQHASIMGVQFKPSGAFPFLGIPAIELIDKHVDLHDLWGPSAFALRERLCLADPSIRFSILEEVLLTHLHHAPVRHGAVSAAIVLFRRSDMVFHMHEVALQVGLSQRRFIQLFKTEVGLTPKLYSRIQRFQRARLLTENLRTPDWLEVAMRCGYFDQSHLIHDFLKFSGLTPTAYIRKNREHLPPNHLPEIESGQLSPIQGNPSVL